MLHGTLTVPTGVRGLQNTSTSDTSHPNQIGVCESDTHVPDCPIRPDRSPGTLHKHPWSPSSTSFNWRSGDLLRVLLTVPTTVRPVRTGVRWVTTPFMVDTERSTQLGVRGLRSKSFRPGQQSKGRPHVRTVTNVCPVQLGIRGGTVYTRYRSHRGEFPRGPGSNTYDSVRHRLSRPVWDQVVSYKHLPSFYPSGQKSGMFHRRPRSPSPPPPTKLRVRGSVVYIRNRPYRVPPHRTGVKKTDTSTRGRHCHSRPTKSLRDLHVLPRVTRTTIPDPHPNNSHCHRSSSTESPDLSYMKPVETGPRRKGYVT